jgi:hypothetical protein
MDSWVKKELKEWNLSCLEGIFEGKVLKYIFI